MCADQLTQETHKRKAFLYFSEFQFCLVLYWKSSIISARIVKNAEMQFPK